MGNGAAFTDDQNETASNTFVNNRMQYWGYDAAGAVVYADATSYTRDAAGRSVHADSETSHGTYTFDGDQPHHNARGLKFSGVIFVATDGVWH